MQTQALRFNFPTDGDMLHAKDGDVIDGKLHTNVCVNASAGRSITISGTEANRDGENYSAGIILSSYKTKLEAKDIHSGETAAITIYWLPDFAGKYRISIDDNIRFLQDLHQHEDSYTSIFDNEYLYFLRQVHQEFGTKFHLNLFYQTDGFNLSQLSDQYKPDWKANANWLRLSFHAMGEFPDKPYIDAGYDQVKKDCNLIDNEIRRFAGQESMGSFTTVHWGEASKEGVRALHDCGYRGLLGYFNVDDDLPSVSYYFTADQTRHIKKRWVWKDNQLDMAFIRTSMVIDKTNPDEIIPHLDSYKQNNHLPPYLDMLVHEQYYYPDYFNYEADYRDRFMICAKWARDNQYEPGFLSEVLFEK